jgi:uroporphyrinogen-III synthase
VEQPALRPGDHARKRPLALVTRPRRQALATARRLRRLGFRTLIEPLLEIEPVATGPIETAGVTALLLTSANAVTAFEPRLAELPVLAVGDATAAAAREAGWHDVRAAAGDAIALAELVRAEIDPRRGALLHLSGDEVRDLATGLAAAGYEYRRLVVYRATPATRLSKRASGLLAAGAMEAVLLFSPRTAAVFRSLVAEGGAAGGLSRSLAACLSEAVADRVTDLPWRELRVAARRDEAALLACLEGLSGTC